MKKFYVPFIFVALIVAGCAPSAPVSPTATALLTDTATATSTPIPLIEVDGLKIPDPRASNPELFDESNLHTAIAQFIHALSVVGIEVAEQQILYAMNNLNNYRTKRGVDQIPYVQFAYPVSINETSYSFAMIYTQETGWTTDFSDILRAKGITLTARAQDFPPNAPSFITGIRLETGESLGEEQGRKFFNYNSFDWSKVIDNWDNVERQLRAGVIPFENEVFGTGLQYDLDQISFAVNNNLSVAGDYLFYPAILYEPGIAKLSNEDQIKVLSFMAAAKSIKLDKMSTINLAAEVAGFRVWQTQQFEGSFQKLGGYQFLADLAKFVKVVRPDLVLGMSEGSMIDPAMNVPDFKQHYDMVLEMLGELKDLKVPIEIVQLQNEGWIGNPPTQESVENPVKAIIALGYGLDASDTLIATGDTNPIWTNWPQTAPVSSDVRRKLLQQSDIYWLIFKVYLDNGQTNLGVFGITEDWLNSDSNLFTSSGGPKLPFYRVQDLVLSY